VCGDGILTSDEQCDAGGDNGVICKPECDRNCTYCNDNCNNAVIEGNKCHQLPPPISPPNGVPEFTPFALGLAVIATGLGITFLRKSKN
jgi:hypothetical protein